MSSSKSRVGLMGGTFDPIHFGHLVAAEEARVAFGLTRVIFVPSGHPPHKRNQDISSGHDRYLMTFMATLNNPAFEACDFEVGRDELSFAIDTVRYFSETFGDDTELFFITGADACLEILGWKDSYDVLSMCSFIAATRPGISRSHMEDEIERLYPDHIGCFNVLEVPALAISSTDIRERVRSRRSIRYLVPDPVGDYIEKSGMYVR